MRRGLAAVTLIALTGCGLLQVEQADPRDIPAGRPEAISGAPEPIGPMAEVGRGRSLGFGWRYVVYESAEGVCTQLELATAGGSGCGSILPPAGEVFGSVGSGSSSSGPTTVEGMVTEEVASVRVHLVGGGGVDVVMMSLEPAGLSGKAFVGIAPPGSEVESITALDDDGEVIETFAFLAP